MKTITHLLVTILLIWALFHIARWMMVYPDAEVMVPSSACPVDINAAGDCVLTGASGHNFYGDTWVRLVDGREIHFSSDAVIYRAWHAPAEYRPTGLAGIWILLALFVCLQLLLIWPDVSPLLRRFNRREGATASPQD